MSNKIPWNAFSMRRKLSLKDLCESLNLTRYEDLQKHLNNIWVEAPSRDSQEWKLIEEKISETKKASFISKIKKTGLHPDGRKLKKGEDPELIWESALAGSYMAEPATPLEEPEPAKAEIKKTAVKKASTRKASTTRKTSTRKTSTKKKS